MADRMTESEIQAKEAEWAQLGTELEADLKKMRANPGTPQAAIQRHEKAIGALHKAYVGLRKPDDLSAIEAREAHEAANRSQGLTSALSKAERLQKSDTSLSSAQAFRESMRDPEVLAAYYRESGTQPPVLTRQPSLSKADRQPNQSDVEAVEHAAERLVKAEGLSPSAAFVKAMREAGVYPSLAA